MQIQILIQARILFSLKSNNGFKNGKIGDTEKKLKKMHDNNLKVKKYRK